jgi:hypothetical protein
VKRAILLLLAAAAALAVAPAREAAAKPPFARREGKACGYCHINPRGGGPRNARGLEYARNEFSFPVRATNLNVFERDRDRDAMVRARKLVDADHVKAALEALRKLERGQKENTPAAELVRQELHALEVKGTEILGRARLLMRGAEREEGVELLALLAAEFKGLDVHADAADDLKEAKRDKELGDVVRREEREAKARVAYLDGVLARIDGGEDKARAEFERVCKAYEGTRAAEAAAKELAPPKTPEEKTPEK